MSAQSVKPGWKMMKFGDIAQNIAVRIDPAEATTDVYVGLEHLDPETLHLRQWGHPSDVTGQKLVFKKGDVIFGRRRAYQRKLAVVEFDGICSAHAMVVRAKPEMILPEFLPFFLQSDMFMERAIEISVGSLSPTINWKTLRIQEFPLPPIKEQKRIAEILWAADKSVESYQESLLHLEKLTLIECDKLFQDVKKMVKIQDVVDQGILAPPQDGNHGNSHPKAKDYVDSGIPFIMASNISKYKLDTENCKFLPKSLTDKLRIGYSIAGDVLLSHKGTVGEVAIVPTIETPYIMLTPQVTYYRIKDNQKLNPKFLFFCFISRSFQLRLKRLSAQSTRAYVGITAQRKFKIPLPDIDAQNKLVVRLERISAEVDTVLENINTIKRMANTYLNSIARIAVNV
jgi:restriction endonuclease S subunit